MYFYACTVFDAGMLFAFLRFNFYEWIGNELILYEDGGMFQLHLA
jgi:hypothetical protein